MKKSKTYKMVNLWLLLIAFICATINSNHLLASPTQQGQTVNGTVTSQQDEPLPGVNVTIQGTNTGTVTDVNGNYSLEVPDPEEDVLVFSFVGYETREIPVNNRTEINVSLARGLEQLEEVVVIGYGTREQVSMTGSISKMDANQVQVEPTGNIVKSLQGNMSGVNVVRGKDPGSSAQVRIHGLGTIGNNSPLWIVDGVPTGGLNEISSSEIESITVLKDAASTAVYGARGANGVILVETIEGEKGEEAKINFSSRFGMSRAYQKYDMLGVEELGEVRFLSQRNAGIDNPSDPIYGNESEPTIPNYLLPAGADQVDESQYDRQYNWEDGDPTFLITRSNPEGTDWYDAVFRDAMLQEHSLSISGGSETTTYGISAGYLEEEGAVVKTKFNRFSLRGNSTIEVTDWMEVGERLQIHRTNDMGYQGQGNGGVLGQVLRFPKIVPLNDIQGHPAPVPQLAGVHANNNPLGRAQRREDVTRIDLGIKGNVFTQITPIENLRVKSLFGFDLGNFHQKSPLEKNYENVRFRLFNQLSESYNKSRQWNWTNTATYNGSIGDIHSYEVLLGTEAIESTWRSLSAERSKFFQTSPDYWIMDAGEQSMINGGNATDWATFSIFGRVHYELYNKYLVDFTVRRDGSSRFGQERRFGTFPAVSAAWRIGEENFMGGTDNWLNELKLRASWGQSGNDQIGNYNGFTTFASNRIFSYYPIQGQNNDVSPGIQSASFGNPGTKWETTTSANIGIDATTFDRLRLSFDVWQKNTHDMLYNQSIPFVRGIADIPDVNIGEMKNIGWDLELSYRGSGLDGELTYNLSTNLSHFQNEIIKLSGKEGEFLQGPELRESIYTRAKAGTAFPEFYGYKVLGIFQSQSEADNHPPAFGEDGTYNAPGHFKYKDVNGDGVITEEDRTFLGSPHPDLSGSVRGNVKYSNFDLSAQFYGLLGNEISNVERRSLDFNFFQRNRGKRRLYESWGSPHLENNENAKMPIAEVDDAESQLPSSYYIEDGSFLRLQQVQLGYSLPSDLTPLRNLRIYVMGSNLFTLTKFSGLDPEISWDGMGGGLNLGNWPVPRRYTIGLNIGL